MATKQTALRMERQPVDDLDLLTQPESVRLSVCQSDSGAVGSDENSKELSGDIEVSDSDCDSDKQKNTSTHDITNVASTFSDSRSVFSCEENLCISVSIVEHSPSNVETDCRTAVNVGQKRPHPSDDERNLCTIDQAPCGDSIGFGSTGTLQSDFPAQSQTFTGGQVVLKTNPDSQSRTKKNESDHHDVRFSDSHLPSEKVETDRQNIRLPDSKTAQHNVRLSTQISETGDESCPTKHVRLDDDARGSELTQGLELAASGQITGVMEHDLINDDSDQGDNKLYQDATTVSVVYNLSKPPQEICYARTEFSEAHNYLKGCKWSPDGSCLLTCSNDCNLRLFNLPEPLLRGETAGLDEMKSVLRMKEGDTIYDYAWYPMMSSLDPPTCCLVSTSGKTPVHMWDAFTGELRCTYRAFNQVDEVVPAYSLSFSTDGNKLYCGFNKMIRVFDVDRPGRQCQQRPTYVKEGQAGIISCIVSSPTITGLYAAGSYSRSIALYHEPKGDMACMFEGQQGGVTHLKFTPDGTKLLSGGRKDSEILCWDLRCPGRILFTAQRDVQTNQRIYFDIDSSGRYLMSGNHDGTVRVWDMSCPVSAQEDGGDPLLEPVLEYQAHADTVNGASFHPSMPLVLTSSGQRHFKIHDLDSEGEETEESSDRVDNSLKLWYI